ncbi:MFS superfamily sulfate permease-like transporter [Methylobacter tundripaludum]|uniref:MFS superfamily sulfate permease-like transporter n=1 Tax=Methylobacter tundripaludum TaxID=173365 RepID=A0A2S6H3D7_9GAMM|nr:SulP family inorganic anion transporter [Methylobacter tundripaludum]PPK71930.1 MFS superfamily sulfate permease-like transporter [Methylobacter tundripaludum]
MNESSLSAAPKTGLAGLKENWLGDLQSGFLVFLIALPLCLGISVASGFPPSAGIITAIIGGVLVSRISGSYLTINGPAAGLIVVVLAAVQALGEGDAMAGYRYTLAAIVVASVLQVLMGVFKLGQLSSFFPTSVVHGMLAAIGIIIIATQTHVMLGVTPESGNLFSVIAQIPHSLLGMNAEIGLISFLGLLVLVIWPFIGSKIPAPIIVVLVGVVFAWHFNLAQDAAVGGAKFLVSISEDFSADFYFPDFSKLFSLAFWEAVFSISLVGSLESLLSTTAIDKLDPCKRSSDLDRDLTAVGLGNIVAGFIGGLPMIAEIVRSSENVNNGAKTTWSNFFHGLFLLVFVVLFPGLINSIPLASLAALLVYTGYRLASPETFYRVKEVGKEQLFIFVVTIIGVLATDLLVGVALGIVVKLAINLVRGVWPNNLFKIHFTVQRQDNDTLVIKLLGSALFSNFLPLKKALNQLEKGKTIIFDFTDGYMIDHTVMEFIHDFKRNYEAQGGQCRKVGKALETFSDHALAARLMTPDDRKQL